MTNKHSNTVFIDVEGKLIGVLREKSTARLDLQGSKIAGCCSSQVAITKIQIPPSYKPDKTSAFQWYSYKKLVYTDDKTPEEVIKECTRMYWCTKKYLVFETQEELKKYLAPDNEIPAAQCLLDAFPEIRSKVGQQVGYGHLFYMAWNHKGDQYTLTPEDAEATWKLLEKEGYQVVIQTTRLSNILYKAVGRKPNGEEANVVMQITVVYMGLPAKTPTEKVVKVVRKVKSV